MTEVKWTDPNTKEVWVRKGDCNNCGQCCMALQIETPKTMVVPNDFAELLDAHGYKRNEQGNHVTNLEHKVITISHICNNLIKKDAGENKYKCAIYDKRPEICKKFPWMPIQRIAGCGYSWEKEEIKEIDSNENKTN